ncbi:cysteine protease precursor TacP [Theileria orientalis]|uniref:Cysteine protease TacP n=1 Tax=Theileria orientalis TaxID=68886 RepID=A0A976M7A1_THEOR|nr:cysteine protease precursor TacP [Theileria orientalis]
MPRAPPSIEEDNYRVEIEKGSEIDREATEDLSSFNFKTRRFFTKRIFISVLIFVFLILSVALIIYTFFSKSLADKKFSKNLLKHVEETHPTLSKKLKDVLQNELNELYKERSISDDYDLELETLIEFHKYMHKYKKHYEGKERSKRHLLFRRKYFDTKEQKGDRTYLKGINKFSDLTPEERRLMLSNVKPIKTIKDHNKQEDLKEMLERHLTDPAYLSKLKIAKSFENNITDVTKITGENLDWRRAEVVSPVKDQGDDCGSCWAFAAVASVESLFRMLQDSNVDLSEQHLINCDKKSNGCKGGFSDVALDFVKNKGLPEANIVPYTGKDGQCTDPDTDRYFIDLFTVFTGDDIFNKSLVYSPTVVNIGASDKLFDYKRGIYDDECSVQMNHAVLLVGEGYDPESKKRYWIIKNSWGSDWGEDGYLRLERTKNGLDKCGILTAGLNPFITHYIPREYVGNMWY